MEGTTAKPGADLLWAFQLHREHRALTKRLIAVETTTARQQDRLTASERDAQPAQKSRIDALTERLRKLEDSDADDRVAGLAGELRGTRQKLEQVCDKVKLLEKASREASGKQKDKGAEFQARLGELSGAVAHLQGFAERSESRFKHLADQSARTIADAHEVTSERHEDQIKGLGEQLSSLEQAQGHLRALIEDLRQDDRTTRVIPASTSSKARKDTSTDTTLAVPSKRLGGKRQPQGEPHVISRKPGQDPEVLGSPALRHSSNAMPPDAEMPALSATRAEQKKPSGTTKRKRGFEEEITQLIHGDGSLTNAPIILESQSLGASTRGSKKLKVEPVEGRSLRSAYTKPDTQTQIEQAKKQPALTRAKAAALPAKSLVTDAKKGAKNATKTAMASRAAPKAVVTKTKGRKGLPPGPLETPLTKQPQPLPLSSSSEIQVAYSRGSSVSEQAPDTASPPVPVKTEKGVRRQNGQGLQQPPKQRRRRIEQDDSMEEFLAKCEAAMET